MRKYLYWFWFLLFCYLFGYTCKWFYYSCKTSNKSNIESLKKTIINFKTDKFDFGEIDYNKEAYTYFKYKNTGVNDLIIKNVYSSCGCTVPIWSKEKLSPNKVDSLLVKYDAEKKGFFSKTITIIYNGKDSIKKIKIKGIVI